MRAAAHRGRITATRWARPCVSRSSAASQCWWLGSPLKYNEAERHASQQRALADMLVHDFGDPRVRYINLADAVDLSNSSYAFDGLHLSREANAMVASRLVEPVKQMVALRRESSAKN